MRYREIISERATPKGASKFVSPKTSQVFYITHRTDGGTVQCHAYAPANSPYEPLRRKVGVASCEMVDRNGEPGRNNVRVYSSKTFVEPEFRRHGLLNAMYDHLDAHGYVVYPANGEIGDNLLQAQTDDAKKFWAARKARASETRLEPTSEAEVHGWGKFNPYANATSFGGLPVIRSENVHGYQYPMLILWEKQYSSGLQSVGIMYDPERGYRCVARFEWVSQGYKDGETDFVYLDGKYIRFSYSRQMEKRMKAGTANVLHKVASMIENRAS